MEVLRLVLEAQKGRGSRHSFTLFVNFMSTFQEKHYQKLYDALYMEIVQGKSNMKITVKIVMLGRWDGSESKGTRCQRSWFELGLWDPPGGRREPAPVSCPLASHVCFAMHALLQNKHTNRWIMSVPCTTRRHSVCSQDFCEVLI